MNTYQNHEGQTKQTSRYLILDEITSLFQDKNKPLTIVTLANTCYKLEERLLKLYDKLTIFLIEIDENIHKQQINYWKNQRLKPEQRVIPIYNSIGEVILNNKIDFVWFDYCGYITENLITQTSKFIFSNTFNDNNFICVTAKFGRENKLTQEYQRREFNRLYHAEYKLAEHRKFLLLAELREMCLRKFSEFSILETTACQVYRTERKSNKGSRMCLVGITNKRYP